MVLWSQGHVTWNLSPMGHVARQTSRHPSQFHYISLDQPNAHELTNIRHPVPSGHANGMAGLHHESRTCTRSPSRDMSDTRYRIPDIGTYPILGIPDIGYVQISGLIQRYADIGTKCHDIGSLSFPISHTMSQSCSQQAPGPGLELAFWLLLPARNRSGKLNPVQ